MTRLDAPTIVATSPALAAGSYLFPTWTPYTAPPATVNAEMGTLLDTSSWSAWSLRLTVATAIIVYAQFVWFDDTAGVPAWDGLQDTAINTATGPGEYRIVGRVRSPLCALVLNSTVPIPAGAIRAVLQFSNRERTYDAPYTPERAGEYLVTLPRQAVAGGGGLVAQTLPFYIGPARIAGEFGAAVNTLPEVRIRTGNNWLANANFTAPNADLWIPPDGGTPWTFELANNAAGALNLAGSVTAQ